MRHPELKEAEWLAMFWRWQARFPSPQALVSETPAVVCTRERLYVPNKLTRISL
jgi:hypothetical protein